MKPVATGAGNGSTWTDASADLQAMINASASGDEVWVAAGTYKPTTTTDRSISFSMKDGVAIYGGFAGTEALLSQRNWTTNVTILSGDIGAVGNNSDNSYSVIRNITNGLTASSLLNGFTITGGTRTTLTSSYHTDMAAECLTVTLHQPFPIVFFLATPQAGAAGCISALAPRLRSLTAFSQTTQQTSVVG